VDHAVRQQGRQRGIDWPEKVERQEILAFELQQTSNAQAAPGDRERRSGRAEAER
jgi:hypothetical protein